MEERPPRNTQRLPDWMRWESVPALVGSRRTRSLVAYPKTEAQCREALAFCRQNGLTICPRGSGHSYGDQALNDGATARIQRSSRSASASRPRS